MRSDLTKLYDAIYSLYCEQTVAVDKAEDLIKSSTNAKEAADDSYVLNECFKLLDDLRKRVQVRRELSDKVACLLAIKDNVSPIKTEYCTASPRLKQMASLPKHGTEAHAKLMEYLGIPREMWEKDVVRVHWPAFTEWLTTVIESGETLPDGLDADSTYPVYALTIRPKKGINE